MDNKIPVILVHKGNTFYLKPVLEHIRLFNPDTRICLLSDASTKGKFDFVEHYNLEDYSAGAKSFEAVYDHMSSNPYEFELICFQRWFYAWDFAKAQGLDYFFCMDSDVLLYCNIDTVLSKYKSYDFTICNRYGPGCSLFNISSITRFCEYMMSMYTKESLISRMKTMYQGFIDNKQLGGVCDMTAFTWFQDDEDCNVADIAIPENGVCFDGCITWDLGFEYENGKKKVYWVDNLPYGRLKGDPSLIRFYCLHLQGRAKYSIFKYVLDKNKVHRSGFLYTLKWMLSKEIVKARLRGVKKAIHNPQLFVNFIKAKLK
ncbi:MULTISPECIES: hypothetical protein [Parabacteroides]|jgi:hypothetical protein|uniref:hypothetical protein n=1 Tax=Parabacteroides TaxID=375288 RepID=UPI000EFF722C|nr:MULTISPECIES: hypothetical protein [Parabacteroides]RHU26110.1 hypothetical protein DXD68_12150 [Parabacteroides sp. TM07-1AC]WFE86394.1 hypothetical protein P3L47_07300 [Parabacteroides chongii]